MEEIPDGQIAGFAYDLKKTVGNIEERYPSIRSKKWALPAWRTCDRGLVSGLDYAALGLKSSPVKSVFSGTYTGLLIHETGAVAVDYAPDIMTLVQREQRSGWDEDEDFKAADRSFLFCAGPIVSLLLEKRVSRTIAEP